LFGEGIFAYVTLKENVKLPEKELIEQLKALVKSKIAHYAIPHRILVNFCLNFCLVTLIFISNLILL
jgi:acyl-coenzyme A synthetase/AMP-(fatty) acid ligase